MTDDNTEDNIPPSPEVRKRHEEVEGLAAYRRKIAFWYLPWVALGAVGLGTVWFNALYGSRQPWVPAVVATIWIVWGTWAHSKGRAATYELGWMLGSISTASSITAGHDPGSFVPHLAVSGYLVEHLHEVAEAVRKDMADKGDEGNAP